MTFIWLIVWLLYGTPVLHLWNAWAVSIAICAALDLLGNGPRVTIKK
jgi:hypothetical protein